MQQRMSVDQTFHIFAVATANHTGHWIALGYTGAQNLHLSPKKSGIGEGKFAQNVISVRINLPSAVWRGQQRIKM
jgi:hypothetical protein